MIIDVTASWRYQYHHRHYNVNNIARARARPLPHHRLCCRAHWRLCAAALANITRHWRLSLTCWRWIYRYISSCCLAILPPLAHAAIARHRPRRYAHTGHFIAPRHHHFAQSAISTHYTARTCLTCLPASLPHHRCLCLYASSLPALFAYCRLAHNTLPVIYCARTLRLLIFLCAPLTLPPTRCYRCHTASAIRTAAQHSDSVAQRSTSIDAYGEKWRSEHMARQWRRRWAWRA